MDPQVIAQASETAGDTAAFARLLEDRHQLAVILDGLYSQMSPRDHELFELLFMHGRTPKDVAESLGLARGAVNTWCYRFRKLARELANKPQRRATEAGLTDKGNAEP